MVRRCLVVLLLIFGAACADADDEPDRVSETVDHEAIGLWDDGPCDPSLPPLVVGLMATLESPLISMQDQALALDASATAFNERGGANGACIEVHTCDDGANHERALQCVRELDGAGVVATINDQGTAANAEVSAAMAELGIPRVASNLTPSDWGDPNAFPTDASGTGFVFLLPQAMVDEGVTDLGLIRVDLAEASAMVGMLESIYADQGATFSFDVAVPAGTTDYSQFVLAAEDEGVDGVALAVGQQEALQIVRAGQQLSTDLQIGTSTGTMSHRELAELGDLAGQLVLLTSYPPATAELPVYEALRADFRASGEALLEPDAVASSPIRSWIGLYALLWMIRDTELTEFSRANLTSMLREAEAVPMLGMFGDEDWTPDLDHPGLFARAGTNHWSTYRWDPDAPAPDGLEGNFVEVGTMSFDEVLCGSIFGAPPPC